MSPRVDFCSLPLEERLVAEELITKLGERFTWPRVIEIFRALDRGDALATDLRRSTLLREERIAAAEVQFFLAVELPDEAQHQRVIACLTSGQALLAAVITSELMNRGADVGGVPWFDEDEDSDGTVIVM